MLQNGASRNFLGAISVTPFLLRRLENVLVLPLFLRTDASHVFLSWHGLPPDIPDQLTPRAVLCFRVPARNFLVHFASILDERNRTVTRGGFNADELSSARKRGSGERRRAGRGGWRVARQAGGNDAGDHS